MRLSVVEQIQYAIHLYSQALYRFCLFLNNVYIIKKYISSSCSFYLSYKSISYKVSSKNCYKIGNIQRGAYLLLNDICIILYRINVGLLVIISKWKFTFIFQFLHLQYYLREIFIFVLTQIYKQFHEGQFYFNNNFV